MRTRFMRAMLFTAVLVTPIATVAAVSALPAPDVGCVASGGRTPAVFFESREEALADFSADHSLPAASERDFEQVADNAVRAAVATLQEALPAAAPPGGVHPIEMAGRPIGKITITKFDEGWAVTDYEIEVPAEVCERIAELRRGG